MTNAVSGFWVLPFDLLAMCVRSVGLFWFLYLWCDLFATVCWLWCPLFTTCAIYSAVHAYNMSGIGPPPSTHQSCTHFTAVKTNYISKKLSVELGYLLVCPCSCCGFSTDLASFLNFLISSLTHRLKFSLWLSLWSGLVEPFLQFIVSVSLSKYSWFLKISTMTTNKVRGWLQNYLE